MPNRMDAETRDDRDLLNCFNAVNPWCRRRDRPNPVLDDEADADGGDNRGNCATALEARKHDYLEKDPHKRQDREREDRSPNEGKSVDVDEKRNIRAQAHDVPVSEICESSHAVDESEADGGDDHDAAHRQSRDGVIENRDTKQDREEAVEGEEDDGHERPADELAAGSWGVEKQLPQSVRHPGPRGRVRPSRDFHVPSGTRCTRREPLTFPGLRQAVQMYGLVPS